VMDQVIIFPVRSARRRQAIRLRTAETVTIGP
jgi:hypothetical protein